MRKNKKYSKEIKCTAVYMYINDGKSAESIARELDIKSPTQVKEWIKKYKKDGEKAFEIENRGKHSNSKGRPKSKFKSLEEEVEYLRAENAILKKLEEITRR